MTITIGTWIIPAILTFIFFTIAIIETDKVPNTGFMGNGLHALFYGAAALIGSLAIWLMWSLAKLGGWL